MKRRAFTIVEMLVAMGITMLMIALIATIFQQMQAAVSLGIKKGEILVESETIGNQIERDAESMRPPQGAGGNGGFLVIVQKQLAGVPMRKAGEPGHKAPAIRSDQLIFIGNPKQDTYESLTPKRPDRLSSNITADYARIWYGHAARTEFDGITPVALDDGSDGSPNRYANNWVLARHALLLAGGVDSDSDGVYDDTNLAYGSDVHATDAQWSDAIDNHGTPFGSPQLYHGFTDIADREYSDIVADINAGAYPDSALPYAVPDDRPWINPAPMAGEPGIRANFQPWRVGQMHMNLANNVSDIIVEFAGDYEGGASGGPDGMIDKDGDGNIKWYVHDDLANEPGTAGHDARKPNTWPASSANLGTANPNVAHYDNDPSSPTADAVFVFEHTDDVQYDGGTGENSKWPYLILIRYRLHDSRGYIGSSMPDPNGGGDWLDQPGQWFEHVIKVNRP